MSIPPIERAFLANEVQDAVARGWKLTLLKGKKPIRKGWQKEEALPVEVLLERVEQGGNIGVRTGRASTVVIEEAERPAEGAET